MEFIKDPALGSYFIQIDDLNYSAFQKIIPDSGIPYDSLVGHFSTLGRALERIAEHKVRQQSYGTIREYIEELKIIKNELKNIV
tara:strand:+ start:913 stop:1164 length:252 start_codon:yes stop_codon:yes gene_type:complete